MMSIKACAAKAAEMESKADECFSVEAADSYRLIADEWRQLMAQAAAQAAWEARDH
jgi:hypothetical protein